MDCVGPTVAFPSGWSLKMLRDLVQKTISLASLQFSGTLPEATDGNNNNIAILKEICIGRNCFPD